VSQRRGATDEQVRKLREWRALPKNRRPRSIAGMAAVLGISEYVAKRAAYGMRAYADTQRVSRGFDALEESCREKGPQARSRSVASSAGTPGITGVACGSETRYHESKAETRGVTGNAGAAGGGRP
jgi:hypothetical protein